MTIKQPSWFTFKQINTIKDYEILDTGKREHNKNDDDLWIYFLQSLWNVDKKVL